MGGVGSLLDLSRRALSVQTQAIRVVGDNISNVNTPGYSRRRVELVTTQSTGIGNILYGTGVAAQRNSRYVDAFVNKEYVARITDRAQAAVRQEYLARAEQPFSLESSPGHIGYELTQFFSSLQDLASNPADISLRNQVLQHGQSLTTSVSDTYNSLASLQREANDRIGTLVNQVNNITGQIADLNQQISIGETSNQENLTLRDRRDQLIRDLGEIIPFDALETNDRKMQIFLPNGFALVNGSQSNQLEFVTDPSFQPSGGYPPGLDGSALGHIVYDFDSTASDSHIDFTRLFAGEGGSIGGLLRFRGVQAAGDTSSFDAVGDVVDLASRVEAIARDLLTRFNEAYRGPDEDSGTAGVQPSSGSLNDITTYTPTTMYGLFGFPTAPATANAGTVGVPEDADLNAMTGIYNFASVINFGVSDARELAVALDTNTANGATTFLPGDGSTIDRLLALRTATRNFSVGNYTANNVTVENVYSETVGFVGSVTERANADLSAYQAREAQVKELQTSISGVNLDDEFAQLINYQRAFEAAARMVRVGDELLQQVLGLLN